MSAATTGDGFPRVEDATVEILGDTAIPTVSDIRLTMRVAARDALYDVTVEVSCAAMQQLGLRAARNKSRRADAGPIVAKARKVTR